MRLTALLAALNTTTSVGSRRFVSCVERMHRVIVAKFYGITYGIVYVVTHIGAHDRYREGKHLRS